MKTIRELTVSVRIKESQRRALQDLVDLTPGGSLNGVVQSAVQAYITCELPVLLARRQEERETLSIRKHKTDKLTVRRQG